MINVKRNFVVLLTLQSAAAAQAPSAPTASAWSLMVAIFLLMLAFPLVMQRKGLDAATH